MTERRRPGETSQPPIRDTLPLGSAASAAVAASPSSLRPAGTPAPDPRISTAATIAAAPVVRADGSVGHAPYHGGSGHLGSTGRVVGSTAGPTGHVVGSTGRVVGSTAGPTGHVVGSTDRVVRSGHLGSTGHVVGSPEHVVGSPGHVVGPTGHVVGSTAGSPGHVVGSTGPGGHVGSTSHSGSHLANRGAYQTDVIIPPTPTTAGGPRTAPADISVQLGTARTMAVDSNPLGTAPTIATPPGGNLVGTAPTMAVSSGAGIPDGTLDLPAADRVDAAGTLAPGQLIGRFVVRSQLGEGGMGVVLAGHDADLGRPVAIKLVKRELDHPAYRQRLLREAQAMACVEHPNVARVYEVGSERGRLFVAMELIDGVTLATWLRVQRRPWREIVAMFEQVGAGLAAVHRADLVHRDFKPDNVLVDRDGRARVVDFGLARIDHNAANVSPELAVSLTRTGVMMGTPGYMPPEQQFGGTVDARADQYSFCVALREALLGGRPVDPPDAAWHGTPRNVRAAIARGLAYEPNARFASMDELLAALRTAPRRAWLPYAVAATAVAVAGTVVAVIALREPSSSPSPTPSPVTETTPAKPSPTITPLPAIPDMTKDVREAVNAEIRKRVASLDTGSGGGSASLATEPAPKLPPAAPPAKPAKKPDKVEVRADAPATPGSGAPPALPSATQTTPGGPPLTVQRAPRLPAAHVGDPGHLPLVRATIRDLGWDGFDAGVDASKVGELAGAELGITNVKVGMLERRRGRCDLAARYLTEATQQLDLHQGDEAVWRGRAHTNLAICALAGGVPAENDVNSAWLHGNRGHVQVLQALAAFEKGETVLAQALFNNCTRISDPLVQAAIKTWLTGTGLTLP